MYKVFIDGQEGTTGLQLQKRLSAHGQVELLTIDPEKRKDPDVRAGLMNRADVVFLCLPDAAAKEAVSLVTNEKTKIIDASTAHRVAPGWAYGFAELSPAHRAAIASGRRIANPGCHATGFLASVYPLVALGIAGADYPFTCHSVTGYSGGGKKMIALYEDENRPASYDSPRQYGLSLHHKHLPEMQAVAGLAHPPIFNPIVCDFYSGMAVSVPVYASELKKTVSLQGLLDAFGEFYENAALISVLPAPQDGFLPANEIAKTCHLNLYVCGNDECFTLTSVFDNLGKGASGAAVQNMNIALGLDECAYLDQADRLL